MRLVLLLLGGLLAASSASAACSEIRFAPGASAGEVKGQVIDGEPRCFTFGAGSGQSARLQIFGSDNTCFTVPGIADCRDLYDSVTGLGRRPSEVRLVIDTEALREYQHVQYCRVPRLSSSLSC